MPSGNVAHLVGFVVDNDAVEGTGFQVMPSKGNIYNTSNPSVLYIANFDLVGAPGDFGQSTWTNSNTVAAECAMWICVQSYDINVTNTQQTQFVQNFSQVVNSSQITALGAYWTNYTFLGLPANMNPRPDAQYTVDIFALTSFQDFLPPLFNGSIYFHFDSWSPASDIIQAIWNATLSDLDMWMKNVALSMTNALRAFDPASNDMYNGTGYQLGVQVRWWWIILPAALVVSSFITLIVTIIKTARSPVQAWKGSPLALLLLDVDLDIRRSADGRMDTFNGLQDSVGKTKVMMKSVQNGNWAFKAA